MVNFLFRERSFPSAFPRYLHGLCEFLLRPYQLESFGLDGDPAKFDSADPSMLFDGSSHRICDCSVAFSHLLQFGKLLRNQQTVFRTTQYTKARDS